MADFKVSGIFDCLAYLTEVLSQWNSEKAAKRMRESQDDEQVQEREDINTVIDVEDIPADDVIPNEIVVL